MKKRVYNQKVIQDYIKENGMTIKKFCQMCDISYSQYRKILNDDDVYVSTIIKIIVIAKIPFYKMFEVDEEDMFSGVELYNW